MTRSMHERIDNLNRLMQERERKIAQKRHIPFLVFWVGQRCTLHCKDCCNLVPYGYQKLYDVENSIDALYALSKITNVHHLQIQGGEPLSHPELHVFLEKISILPIPKISLTTNGTLCFSDKAIAVLDKNPKISITISNYPCADKKREKLIQQLNHHNINFNIYDFMFESGEWFQSGDLDVRYNDNNDHVQKLYNDCEQKVCIVLADGNLAVCGKLITLCEIKTLNEENDHILPISKIIQTDPKSLVQRLDNFYAQSLFFKEGCRFCEGTYARTTPAQQLSKDEIIKYKKYRQGDFTEILC